jgi:hypothetical protein
MNQLASTVLIRKALEITAVDSISSDGFLNVNNDNIEHIKSLFDFDLIEVVDFDKVNSILINDIDNYINQSVYLELRTGNVSCYFETFDDFIRGNKFKPLNKDFYIAELDYSSLEKIDNELIKLYDVNIQLIDFLTTISNSDIKIGDKLKLIIYRNTNSLLEININYNINDLSLFSKIENLEELKNELLDEIKGNDKKELFLNELVNFASNGKDNYLEIVENWGNIFELYKKSLSLYIAGFSFNKIKTSSNEHFQKLVEKIYESISKASNYIFGIPIGFILLLNYFDYSGVSIFKNVIILLLSLLFFLLIWFILLNNIRESIDAIEEDIDDFISKIQGVKGLESIEAKLSNLKETKIAKQINKLLIVRIITTVIFILTLFVFLYIFFDLSIFI